MYQVKHQCFCHFIPRAGVATLVCYRSWGQKTALDGVTGFGCAVCLLQATMRWTHIPAVPAGYTCTYITPPCHSLSPPKPLEHTAADKCISHSFYFSKSWIHSLLMCCGCVVYSYLSCYRIISALTNKSLTRPTTSWMKFSLPGKK